VCFRATGSGLDAGLECLHSRGFVHKDFKTSNVLLDENLVAKVTDFGLACLRGDGPDMVLSSTPNGTNGFLDPEYNPPPSSLLACSLNLSCEYLHLQSSEYCHKNILKWDLVYNGGASGFC
jgi:serine/threonine protein kinase